MILNYRIIFFCVLTALLQNCVILLGSRRLKLLLFDDCGFVEIPKDTHKLICSVGCENESNLHDYLTVNISLYEITRLGICFSVAKIIGVSDTE